MLNLEIKDLVACFVPLGGAFWLIYTNIKATVEKHRITQKEETTRHLETIKANAERDKRNIEAEVERDKIKADADVEKEREKSLGGEAVAKIWKEVTTIQSDIQKLKEASGSDHSNDLLVNEIIQRLQQDVNRLMNAFFEKVLSK